MYDYREIMGAGVTLVRGGGATIDDAFLSLRLLSLLSGLLLIGLSFVVGKTFIDEEGGWILAACVSISYLLIDYSGNGAMYSLQAALYLLWILVALRPGRRKIVWLGLLTGLCYLLNFQSIVLFPCLLFLFLVQGKNWRHGLVKGALACLIGLLVPLPWFIRNTLLFGDPLYHHYINQIYVFIKAGLQPGADGRYAPGLLGWLSIIEGIVRVWLPNNLYYVARKLFILASLLFPFFAYALIAYAFSWQKIRRLLPVLLVLAFHLLISVSWPVMKFRYFVPMLPLVFLMGLLYLQDLRLKPRLRLSALAATAASLLLFCVHAYRSTPTHTAYYDGAITQDPFHGDQELEFVLTHLRK
jgi:hypothetical protein